MKKKIFVVLACVLAVSAPLTVFAATADTNAAKAIRGFFGIDSSALTDQQKADVSDYNQKMADLQKEFIEKMVANGALTREQGDDAAKKVDEALQNGGNLSVMPGFGPGKRGLEVHKYITGNGPLGVDTSKLTDQQKADLKAAGIKMAELKKGIVNDLAAKGTITQEQGEAAVKKLEDSILNIGENDFFKGLGMLPGGFDLFGIRGIDTSGLTDQQKAELKDSISKVAQLQKEIINTLVENGTITREKGDALTNRIDTVSQNFNVEGRGMGMAMKRGGFHMENNRPGLQFERSTTPAQ